MAATPKIARQGESALGDPPIPLVIRLVGLLPHSARRAEDFTESAASGEYIPQATHTKYDKKVRNQPRLEPL